MLFPRDPGTLIVERVLTRVTLIVDAALRRRELGCAPFKRASSLCASNPYCDHVGGCRPILEAIPVAMMQAGILSRPGSTVLDQAISRRLPSRFTR